MKTVIIEDEKNAQKALAKMLTLLRNEVDIVGIFGSKKEAVPFLRENSIDLLFLDIKLQDATGFEILEALDSTQFVLIFTTAYDEYALKAIKVNAIDYLLKPINPQELDQALTKAQQQLSTKFFFQGETPNFHPSPEKIVLRTSDQTFFIPFDQIIRLEAEGAYTLFFTTDKKIMVSKNLKYYEELLPAHLFVRSHQSHLIAIGKVQSVKSETVLLTNGDQIPISTRKKQNLLEILKNF